MDDNSTDNDARPDLEVNKDGEMSTVANTPQSTTKILVNDVTPPPAPTSSPIEVNGASSDDTNTSEESPEHPAVDQESLQANNDGEAVVPAPDEVQDEAAEDMEHTESQAVQVESSAPTVNAASTSSETESIMNVQANESNDMTNSDVVMGVAASQLGAKPPHRNNRKFAAIITILVALLLAGTAVYVYMSANKNTEQTSQNATVEETTVQQEVTTPATADDVDQTINEIEQSVTEIDDESDLAEKDLSDQTLGL
jgi:hypothetical protein